MEKQNRKKWLISLLLSLFLIVTYGLIGSQKVGFNVDEIFTFGLANHQYDKTEEFSFKIRDGVVYDGEEIFEDYTSVAANVKFDYANVFKNQSADVHPPFYYVLVHTVSSLFKDLPMKTVCLFVHIPLALIVFWQLAWIAKRLGVNETTAVILSLTYVLGYGFVNYIVLFFRMYVLLNVWVNFLIMLFLKYDAGSDKEISYYALLGAVLFGGILTQYLFVFFAFFACLLYALFVLRAKNYRKLIFSVVSALSAFLLAYLVFPAMRHQLFGSYRGKQAAQGPLEGYFAALSEHLRLIDTYTFGGIGLVLIAVLIGVVLYLRKKKRNKISFAFMMSIVPACLHILAAARVAPFRSFRYCVAVVGVLYIGLTSLLVLSTEKIKKPLSAAAMAFVILILCLSYNQAPSYLYLEEKDNLSLVSQKRDLPCMYLYRDSWRIQPNLPELTYFDEIVFINAKKWEEEKEFIDAYRDTPVIVYLDDTYADLLEQVKKRLGSEEEKLFFFGYASAYFLH